MPREAQIIRAAQRLLTKRGAWHINIGAGGAGRNGIPDIIAIYRSQGLALEAKQPGRNPTPLQAHELRQAAKAGALAATITAAADLKRILDDIDQRLDGPTHPGPPWNPA